MPGTAVSRQMKFSWAVPSASPLSGSCSKPVWASTTTTSQFSLSRSTGTQRRAASSIGSKTRPAVVLGLLPTRDVGGDQTEDADPDRRPASKTA